MSKTIFRAYDIRGTFGTTLTLEMVYLIGYYLGTIISNNLKIKHIIIGYDGRLSSKTIFNTLISSLSLLNIKITNLGLIPTPVVYFADKIFNPSASIMITGSHNPKEDNGFKIIVNGNPFFGQEIKDLGNLVLENKDNLQYKFNQIINIPEQDIKTDYLNKIISQININPNLKVVWDPGNGATGEIINMLIKHLPNSNIVINSNIDGNFPNHHPDPTERKNLFQLIKTIQINNYDIGIAFDGDGDRLGVVTKNQNIILGDQLLYLFSKEILRRHLNATIICDVKVSQTLLDHISNLGGYPILCKTGHSFIKTKIKETNAILAGEMSGHIFFTDKYYGYDDAIYAALRLLELVDNQSLDTLIAEIPVTYHTPEIRISIQEEIKFNIVDKIKNDLILQNISFNDIDGIRVSTRDGWWLLRASNTQSALIFRLESPSKEQYEYLINEVKKTLKIYNILLDI